MPAPSARVLVAEPDGMKLQLIDMMLSAGSFDLVPAQSGREALEHLKGEDFDLAILALDLPDLPGDRICGTIRRVGSLARMPVVLIAPQPGRFGLSDEIRARARKVGADLVLPRPLGHEDLHDWVQTLIDASEATPHREGYSTWVIDEALQELSEMDTARRLGREVGREVGGEAGAPDEAAGEGRGGEGGLAGPSSAPAPSPADEIEALRLENQRLRHALAERSASPDVGAEAALRRKIEELEHHNELLLQTLEDMRRDRDEGRGG